MNTHYAVLMFSGDPDGEHPDAALNGSGPRMDLIASGPEEFCWEALAKWTSEHPLRMWEDAEVLARHESVIRPVPSVPVAEGPVRVRGHAWDECPGCGSDLCNGGCP